MLNDQIERLLYDVLAEDIPEIVTSADQLLGSEICENIILAGSQGIISGTDVMRRILEIIDDTVLVKVINGNGSPVEKDDIIAILSGKTSSIEKAKPIITNILSRMSGIATSVDTFVKDMQHKPIRVYDSTNATPLFKPFEQLAFQHGGGFLFDEEFPKQIRLCQNHYIRYGGVKMAVDALSKLIDHYIYIIVEVDCETQYMDAIESDCDMIILHGMTLDDIQQCLSHRTYDKTIIIRGVFTLTDLIAVTSMDIDGIQPLFSADHMHIQYSQTR